ncbi:MAG: hypothetical protein KDD47_04140 [Acidobacteria bacterium]|nr:hypothetical protein [Acidobacteriota bacterium]
MRMRLFLSVAGLAFSLSALGERAEAPISADLAAIKLLALEPVAGHGVIRLPNGEMLLVAEGESLPGTGASVEEVLEDRLVLREVVEEDPPRRRILWMFQAESGKGSSRIQVLDPMPPEEEPVLQPQGSDTDQEIRSVEEGRDTGR